MLNIEFTRLRNNVQPIKKNMSPLHAITDSVRISSVRDSGPLPPSNHVGQDGNSLLKCILGPSGNHEDGKKPDASFLLNRGIWLGDDQSDERSVQQCKSYAQIQRDDPPVSTRSDTLHSTAPYLVDRRLSGHRVVVCAACKPDDDTKAAELILKSRKFQSPKRVYWVWTLSLVLERDGGRPVFALMRLDPFVSNRDVKSWSFWMRSGGFTKYIKLFTATDNEVDLTSPGRSQVPDRHRSVTIARDADEGSAIRSNSSGRLPLLNFSTGVRSGSERSFAVDKAHPRIGLGIESSPADLKKSSSLKRKARPDIAGPFKRLGSQGSSRAGRSESGTPVRQVVLFGRIPGHDNDGNTLNEDANLREQPLPASLFQVARTSGWDVDDAGIEFGSGRAPGNAENPIALSGDSTDYSSSWLQNLDTGTNPFKQFILSTDGPTASASKTSIQATVQTEDRPENSKIAFLPTVGNTDFAALSRAENEANDKGAAIQSPVSNPELVAPSRTENEANGEGAAVQSTVSNLELVAPSIAENKANGEGATIQSSGSSPELVAPSRKLRIWLKVPDISAQSAIVVDVTLKLDGVFVAVERECRRKLNGRPVEALRFLIEREGSDKSQIEVERGSELHGPLC